ncbi:glycosyltransferase family 4 protein [Endothiovibrio diazotrophicus]
MDVLFVHPSFPGQFRRLAGRLAGEAGFRVQAIGDQHWMRDEARECPGVIGYPSPDPVPDAAGAPHPFVRSLDGAVRRGMRVVERLLPLKRDGFEPDLIVAHPGWGDAFYLKDLFPSASVIGLFEFYYQPRGADAGFDPEFPIRVNDLFRIRTLNVTQQLALEACDQRLSPTEWQRSRFPAAYRPTIEVIHDGIDTDRVAPDPDARLTLDDGTTLAAGDEVLTYVSRSLEPYRGFHQLMRALPRILAARPAARVVIVGEEGVSYGRPPADGRSYRQRYLEEVADRLDLTRVHFTGPLPYDRYLQVLQVSRVHLYLTYPFVLSWSALEAMAAGCLVIGSQTGPVEEVIEEGVNGLLVPFFDTEAIAERAIDGLAHPARYRALGAAARRTVIERFDFERVAYPRYRQLFDRLAPWSRSA